VGNSGVSISIREADNVWEFPLLARYRIPLPVIRPFAEVAPNHAWFPGREQRLFQRSDHQLHERAVHRDWPTTYGVVVGGGFQFATGRLQFMPGVRYTNWNQQAISDTCTVPPMGQPRTNWTSLWGSVGWWPARPIASNVIPRQNEAQSRPRGCPDSKVHHQVLGGLAHKRTARFPRSGHALHRIDYRCSPTSIIAVVQNAKQAARPRTSASVAPQ
jgi:hypothetical protein